LMKERRMQEVLELTKKVDIALVGIGTVDPRLSSLVRAGYLTIEEAQQIQGIGAVGDVCGHYFDIHGNLMEIPVAGYAFGTGVETLQGIALSVGVAGGTVKLVNSLVTDDTAARTVLELNDMEMVSSVGRIG
jgi:deoxyribonucleoside regulator